MATRPFVGNMLKDFYGGLLAPSSRAKVDYMGVLAIATYQNVRFRLTDFASAGQPPEYVFDMVQLADPNDRAGKHLGEPLAMPAKLIAMAQDSAAKKGLADQLAQVEIIAWVLAQGRVEQKLEKKCIGGCPDDFKRLFRAAKLSRKEQREMDASSAPGATIAAAPRRARSL